MKPLIPSIFPLILANNVLAATLVNPAGDAWNSVARPRDSGLLTGVTQLGVKIGVRHSLIAAIQGRLRQPWARFQNSVGVSETHLNLRNNNY